MSSSAWKEKIQNFFQSINRKNITTIAGLTAFMGASFLLFRYLQKSKSPATQHIHSIYLNVLKSLEQSGKHRQPLIIQEQHTIQHKNITMIYTLVSKLKQKQKNNEQSIRNPFLPPFEDVLNQYTQGLFIQQLGSSHRLLFNKYNIYDQHLVLVTKEFQPQSLPLTKQDIKQCVYTFKALRGLYFFNSGENAGASQIHKHLQIFPTESKDLPIFRSILQFVRELKYQQTQSKNLNPQEFSIIQYPSFNFKHGLIIIGSNQNHSQSDQDKSKNTNSIHSDIKMSKLIENTYKAYERLYNHLIQNYQGQETPDYNLFGCQHFIMMIPRKKEKAFDQLSINAVGFMGSILFKDKNLLKKYISEERQGLKILEDITFPNSKKK